MQKHKLYIKNIIFIIIYKKAVGAVSLCTYIYTMYTAYIYIYICSRAKGRVLFIRRSHTGARERERDAAVDLQRGYSATTTTANDVVHSQVCASEKSDVLYKRHIYIYIYKEVVACEGCANAKKLRRLLVLFFYCFQLFNILISTGEFNNNNTLWYITRYLKNYGFE